MNARPSTTIRHVSSSSADSPDATVRRGALCENESDTSDNGSVAALEAAMPSYKPRSVWGMALREARAVSLWSLGSFAMRFFWTVLATAAKVDGNSENNDEHQSDWRRYLHGCLAMVAGCIFLLVPSKVATLQAPGFSFGSPWLLEWIKQKTGVFPNFAIRICECYMDRMRWNELATILPMHFLCVVSTAMLIQRSMPDSVAAIALDPIPYAGYGSSPLPVLVIRDLAREAFVTATFVVSLLVIPVLLELNNLCSRWILLFLLYPLFSVSCESSTRVASALAPNVVVALEMLSAERDEHQVRPLGIIAAAIGVRVVGSVLGALMAGKIMRKYFPDGDDVPSKLSGGGYKMKRQ